MSDGMSYTEAEHISMAANDTTHTKFWLRIKGLMRLMRLTIMMPWEYVNNIYISQVTCKFKMEWAKFAPDKFGRNIIDLGIEASLLGNPVNILKKAMSSAGNGQGWRFVSSPTLDNLYDTFQFLRLAPFIINMVFFSDDSALAIRCSDGIFRCNMDISSADASASWGVFYALIRATSGTPIEGMIRKCVEQCQSPFKVSNPYFRHFLTLTPERPLLFSGSLLTTLVNNMGNLLIYSVLVDRYNSDLTLANAPEYVKHCASLAGYKVTIEGVASNTDITKYQFLKTSCDSNGTPYLNLGVILRAIGSSDGCLLGKGTREELALARDQQIITGMRHSGDTRLLNTLRSKFHVPYVPDWYARDLNIRTGKYLVDEFFQETPTIRRDIIESDILSRYGITTTDMDELCSLIGGFDFGTSIDCTATRAIFTLDYGYKF
jgi:hypothetical protein